MIIHSNNGEPIKEDNPLPVTIPGVGTNGDRLKVDANLSVSDVTVSDVTIKDASDPNAKMKVNPDGSLDVKLTGSNVKDYFSGTSNTTRSGFGTGKSFAITNDGNADLTFTIDSLTITVRPGEVFDDKFNDFTSVTVTTTVPFRAIVRG